MTAVTRIQAQPVPAWSFAVLWVAALALLWRDASTLVALAIRDDRYTQVIFAPAIAAFLLFWDRDFIFAPRRRPSWVALLCLCISLVACVALAVTSGRNSEEKLWLPGAVLFVTWVSSFAWANGLDRALAARFPLAMLLFMIPLPISLLDQAVYALQRSSTELTEVLFQFSGMPFFRNGFQFSLPGIEIEVAKECSGIRSTVALLIIGLLASHMFLRTAAAKLSLVLLVIPIAIFKNAVRIVTLSTLAVYVDRGWLEGSLHHRGGGAFALIGALLLVPLFLGLRKLERHRVPSKDSVGPISNTPAALTG